MPLKVKNFVDMMNNFAPENFKEDYDNVGLMVGDNDKEVTSIIVALDCTMKVIDEALSKGCNLIMTHHPLLFHKPSKITSDTLLGRKIIKLIKNDISVYSSHTNLDSVGGGLNDIIMHLLGFNNYKIIDIKDCETSSGIGRIAELDECISLRDICIKVKHALNASLIRYCGDDLKPIKKIAVINGSGQDYFSQAVEKGADCIITGDTTYHYISDLNEQNISVIDAGHFETEWPSMNIIAQKIRRELNIMNFNNSVVLSDTCCSPYKYK